VWRWAYVVASRLAVILGLNSTDFLYVNHGGQGFFSVARFLIFTLLFGTAIVVFDGLALCGPRCQARTKRDSSAKWLEPG
jgi:hypothetical protein